MKFIFRKTISEQIIEAQRKALMENREIEKVILTEKEAKKLESELEGSHLTYDHGSFHRPKITTGTQFIGIMIEVEERKACPLTGKDTRGCCLLIRCATCPGRETSR